MPAAKTANDPNLPEWLENWIKDKEEKRFDSGTITYGKGWAHVVTPFVSVEDWDQPSKPGPRRHYRITSHKDRVEIESLDYGFDSFKFTHLLNGHTNLDQLNQDFKRLDNRVRVHAVQCDENMEALSEKLQKASFRVRRQDRSIIFSHPAAPGKSDHVTLGRFQAISENAVYEVQRVLADHETAVDQQRTWLKGLKAAGWKFQDKAANGHPASLSFGSPSGKHFTLQTYGDDQRFDLEEAKRQVAGIDGPPPDTEVGAGGGAAKAAAKRTR